MKNTAYFFITTIAIVITLIYGQNLLQPFIFALLLWFIVRKIRHGLNKVKFIEKYFPSWLKSLIPSIILISIFAFISKLLMANINSLAKSYPIYEQNVEIMIAQLNEIFQMNLVDSSDSSTEYEFFRDEVAAKSQVNATPQGLNLEAGDAITVQAATGSNTIQGAISYALINRENENG